MGRARASAGLAAGIVLALAVAMPATAQDYPTRPVKFISPATPGGGGDTLVRYFAKKLEEIVGQPFLVENRPGAAGMLGVETVARARPDGYTLLMHANPAVVGNFVLMKKTSYDPMKDLVPVTTIGEVGFALVVSPKSPVRSVADLTEFLKRKAGQATFGSQNNAVLASTEFYKQAVGAEATRINYKSSTEAVSDVAAGEIDFTFADAMHGIAQGKEGRVRVLAVTPSRRVAAAPEIPTMAEAGVAGYDYSTVWGVWVPTGTPPEIVAKLEGWLNRIVATEETKRFMLTQGIEPLPGSAAALAAVMRTDLKAWTALVEAGKIERQ